MIYKILTKMCDLFRSDKRLDIIRHIERSEVHQLEIEDRLAAVERRTDTLHSLVKNMRSPPHV